VSSEARDQLPAAQWRHGRGADEGAGGAIDALICLVLSRSGQSEEEESMKAANEKQGAILRLCGWFERLANFSFEEKREFPREGIYKPALLPWKKARGLLRGFIWGTCCLIWANARHGYTYSNQGIDSNDDQGIQ